MVFMVRILVRALGMNFVLEKKENKSTVLTKGNLNFLTLESPVQGIALICP